MDTTYEHPSFTRAKSLTGILAGKFPVSADEARTWAPWVIRRALSARVLVVAVTRVECAWSAYIDAVPGQNHELEWQVVADRGAKLDESVARTIFPAFDGLPYAD